MMSQTVCWASAPERWMAGLSSQKLHSLVRDEHVQIDIYDTRDNCWRIGLLKGLWKPKGGSKKPCLLTWWIISVLKDANKISNKAGKSIPGRSNRECRHRRKTKHEAIFEEFVYLSVSRAWAIWWLYSTSRESKNIFNTGGWHNSICLLKRYPLVYFCLSARKGFIEAKRGLRIK